MSAVSYVEAAVSSTATEIRCLADDSMTYCAMSKSSSSPYHLNQARIAREAYRDFGKGRHRAGLNLGDCFAYALAKEKGEKLLFKGDEFCHTDIEPAG
jgi:ribonuclease VapC